MDDEYNPSISDSSPQTEQLFRIRQTIRSPNFFVIDKIANDYIANDNKKYHSFHIKCELILIFNNDSLKPIHIETDFYHNTNLINLKRFTLSD